MGEEHGTALGVLLIAATVVVLGGVVRSLALDLWEDLTKSDDEQQVSGAGSAATQDAGAAVVQLTDAGDAHDGTSMVTTNADDVPPPPQRTPATATTQGDSWNAAGLFLCMNEDSEGATGGGGVASENVRLREENAQLRAKLAQLSP